MFKWLKKLLGRPVYVFDREHVKTVLNNNLEHQTTSRSFTFIASYLDHAAIKADANEHSNEQTQMLVAEAVIREQMFEKGFLKIKKPMPVSPIKKVYEPKVYAPKRRVVTTRTGELSYVDMPSEPASLVAAGWSYAHSNWPFPDTVQTDEPIKSGGGGDFGGGGASSSWSDSSDNNPASWPDSGCTD